MSSELQLDVCHLNRWRRHLVNAYEVKAGVVFVAGKTVWSMPERFKVVCIPYKALYKCSALPFMTYYVFVGTLNFTQLHCRVLLCLSSHRRYSVIRITDNSADVGPTRCWNSDGWGGDNVTLLWGPTESWWYWSVCIIAPSHRPLSLPHCPLGEEQTRLCQHLSKPCFICVFHC